jgi:hypothetical protein
MIKAILDYLKSDVDLVSLLNHTDKFPKITPFEPKDKNNYPYVVVTISPLLMGDVDQYKCEVRVVTNDQYAVESINKRILKLLHLKNTSGFKTNETIIYHSKHSGSGFLYDSESKVIEQILNFIIKGE